MPFAKGSEDINRNGRPSVDEQKEEAEHLLQIKASELRASIGRLRRASPKALQILIENMENEDIPLKDRMKYAKDVFDLYVKAVGMDASLKKSKHAMKQGKDIPDESEEQNEKPPAVVFTLHQKV